MTATPTGGAQPRSLRLEFSKAADASRIENFLSPENRPVLDPNAYLAMRLSWAFNEAVATGGAAFLSDEHGEVKTLTMAYHTHISDDPAPGQIHDYTELGTSLASLQGYNSAKLVVAALMLREWLNNPPSEAFVAFIKMDNAASYKTYHDALGWREIPQGGGRDEAMKTTDKTLYSPSTDTGGSIEEKIFQCPSCALAIQARIILEFMAQGGLLNKKTGDFIPVDLSALDREGLTQSRLAAMADGMADRNAVLQI